MTTRTTRTKAARPSSRRSAETSAEHERGEREALQSQPNTSLHLDNIWTMITATGELLGFSGIKVALTRGCLHRLDPRRGLAERRAEATSKPVLLPLAIMLPEDTFAQTKQLLKANVWHNHVVAHMLTHVWFDRQH